MAAPKATHVYILGFSDGVVKVGRTSNVPQRLDYLNSEARRRGATVTGTWTHPVENPEDAEWCLREAGRRFLTPAWGDEYFRGDFDTFVPLARRWTTWVGLEVLDAEFAAGMATEEEAVAAVGAALFTGRVA